MDEIFKIPGSKRERITITESSVSSWLCENGQKVKLVGHQNNTNISKDVLSPGSLDNLEQQMENEAENYVEGTLVKSYNEGQPEAYGSQELWGKMVANFLQPHPLNFIARVIALLKERPVKLTLNGANLADYLFKELTPSLKERYAELPTEKQKEFKAKIPYEINWQN